MLTEKQLQDLKEADKQIEVLEKELKVLGIDTIKLIFGNKEHIRRVNRIGEINIEIENILNNL